MEQNFCVLTPVRKLFVYFSPHWLHLRVTKLNLLYLPFNLRLFIPAHFRLQNLFAPSFSAQILRLNVSPHSKHFLRA